ncbi:MAG: hypothetical protein ACLS43_09315 [Evtepia gabavorous]
MKQWISLLLALVLSLALALPAGAAPPEQEEAAAWQLYYMGLFQGTDTDAEGFPVFSLDRSPTRAQGVTMLVRLLGQEEDALAGTWTTPSRMSPTGPRPMSAMPMKGADQRKSETRIDPDSTIRASEYLTFVLRALGYVSGTDFAWDSAWTLSDKLGITHGEYNASTTSFDRGDVAWISVRALPAPCKDSEQTLEELLADRGIQYNAGRCTWEEECVTCQKDKMVFSLTPTRESKEVYTSFEVTSATANGLPCEIEQYPTAAKVKNSARKSAGKKIRPLPCPMPFPWFICAMTGRRQGGRHEAVTPTLSPIRSLPSSSTVRAPCPTDRWRNWSDWITTLTVWRHLLTAQKHPIQGVFLFASKNHHRAECTPPCGEKGFG